MAMARARVDYAVKMCEKIVLDKVGTRAAGVFGILVKRKDPYRATEAQPTFSPEENIDKKRKREDEERKKSKSLGLLIQHNAAQCFYTIVKSQASDILIGKRVNRLRESKENCYLLILAGDEGYTNLLYKTESDERIVIFVVYPFKKISEGIKTQFRPFGVICFEDLPWNYKSGQP